MKTIFRLLLICLIAAMLPTPAWALSVDTKVTPAYVREHAKEFSVKVTKGKNGLIEFRITRTLSQPMYLVARLDVYHQGKIIASSTTPSFGKKYDNDFYFSISPEDVPESKFELGESSFAESGGDLVPMPGTTNYQFPLQDFVSDDLLESAPNAGDCLKNFESITNGMTRAEVKRRLEMDGGLTGASPVRFIDPKCPGFKITVEFDFKKDAADQGRAITSGADKVIRVSKPYLERPFMD